MGDKKLLVMIDDDRDDHEIFEMALEEVEDTFYTLHFDDCEQALEHFSTPGVNAPGFVFVDINLPRISGSECLNKLQSLNGFDHPRIIVYSSSVSEEWKGKLEQIGVNEFLEKTGSLSDLKENLAVLLLNK